MTSRKPHISEITDPNRTGLVDPKTSSSSPAHKVTGPRTPAGKEKSKYNAVKHGILSKAVLLPNESQREYDLLLSGLRDDFQPMGTLEENLVEKLATLSWRYRRLIIAEAAEIYRGARFLEWDEQDRQRKEAEETSVHQHLLEFDAEVIGLKHRIENPQILERCLDLLKQLKNKVKRTGFSSESDEEDLTKLYGNREHWTETPFRQLSSLA